MIIVDKDNGNNGDDDGGGSNDVYRQITILRFELFESKDYNI